MKSFKNEISRSLPSVLFNVICSHRRIYRDEKMFVEVRDQKFENSSGLQFLCLKFLTFNGSLQRPLSHFRDTTRRCSRPSFLTVILLRAPLSTDVPFLLLNHSIVTRRQRCNFSWENLLASYAKPLGITLSICLTFWSHLPSIWRFYCGHVTSRKILVKAVFFCTNQMLFFQQLSQR